MGRDIEGTTDCGVYVGTWSLKSDRRESGGGSLWETLHFNLGAGEFPALNIPRQWPPVLLIELFCERVKPEINLNSIYLFRSYLTRNTLLLHCKDQFTNVVLWNRNFFTRQPALCGSQTWRPKTWKCAAWSGTWHAIKLCMEQPNRLNRRRFSVNIKFAEI
jgi:hypothetical protein